jgi:hypothetical protein
MKEELSNLFSLTIADGNLSLVDFIINLILTALLTFLIGLLFDRYSKVLSNRKAMIKTFVLVGMTTMLIISIVKSSVSISLGLFGALSIVRFRTAIKEPEELAYFFMCISIGLGMGANEKWITIAGFIILALAIVFLGGKKVVSSTQNLIIRTKQKISETEMLKLLESQTQSLDLRRYDQNSDYSEFAFILEFSSVDKLMELKKMLEDKYENISISFISNS